MSDYDTVARFINDRLAGFQARIGLVLGSGLGAVADRISDPVIIPYHSIPGWPPSTVSGHAGRLLAGTLNGTPVFCLQGRAHYYEGHSAADIVLPVRVLQQLDCETLLLTNAAGSLQSTMTPGSLMMITDHINWAGVDPLRGANDETLGPRFVDMTQAYDLTLQQALRRIATIQQVTLHEGVYLCAAGPQFETPAEIRLFARLGADAVGMSTVAECIAARHCGLRVAAVSAITNLAAGMSGQPLDHAETLTFGELAGQRLGLLIDEFVSEVEHEP